jgi:hypothetical protein
MQVASQQHREHLAPRYLDLKKQSNEADAALAAALDYWVSATNSDEAERTLKERLTNNEVFGYRIAGARPATKNEAAWINLPPNCVMLLA